jgi:phage terminase small subunit
MRNMPDSLTAKQAKFISNFLVTGNGTGAALASGYGRAGAHVTASRLLRNPKVQKALQARQSADATRLSPSREDVLQGLIQAAERARTMSDPAAMISAWREIGRMQGYYVNAVQRVEVADVGNDAMLRRYEALSDHDGAAQRRCYP